LDFLLGNKDNKSKINKIETTPINQFFILAKSLTDLDLHWQPAQGWVK
jgi:hypothetical protein